MSDGGFTGFSCLSMLYAQHAWLMKRISHTFSNEIAAFLDDVRDRVRALSLPRHLHETVADDGCRFWWIGSAHDATQRRIYLCLDPRLPQIVWPGELHVHIRCASGWNSAQDAECCRCARSIQSSCDNTAEKLIIAYDQHAPIESAANQVAALLIDCEPLAFAGGKC